MNSKRNLDIKSISIKKENYPPANPYLVGCPFYFHFDLCQICDDLGVCMYHYKEVRYYGL